MSLAELIQAAIPLSLGLIVIALGMRCAPSEALSLFRQPLLLLRSLLAMNVVMPIVAMALATGTGLSPPIKIALVALAVSPVPPILPNKQLKFVTREAYVYGLLVATAVLSIVLVPVTLVLIGAVQGREMPIDPTIVARAVLISVLVPLAIGMTVRQVLPTFADRAGPVAGGIGSIVLLVTVLAVIASGWRAFTVLIGDGTVLACVLLAVIGLAVGHVFGGPDPDDRTVLALATSARHPGVAIALGASLFPEQKLVPVAVVLYLIAASLASIPYTAWRKRAPDTARGAPP